MKKWEILGYIASIFNPIPTGLLAGFFLYKERKYKKTGIKVIMISLIWPVVLLTLLLVV